MHEVGRQPFQHYSTVRTDIVSVSALAWCCACLASHSAFATEHLYIARPDTKHEVSTCVRNWKERLKNWNQHTVLKPPSHSLRWRELWVLQMNLSPNCCLIVGPLDVNSVHHLLGTELWVYGLFEAWLTGPRWQYHSFAHCRICSWRVLHLWVCRRWDHLSQVISEDRGTAGKLSTTFSCCLLTQKRRTPSEGIRSSPVLKLIHFYALMVHNGVNGYMFCFLLCAGSHPDYWTFHFVKCTSSNTATSVSCEATTLLVLGCSYCGGPAPYLPLY